MKKIFSIFMLAAIATIACFTLNSCENDGEEIDVLFEFKFSNADTDYVNKIEWDMVDKMTTRGFQAVDPTSNVIYKNGSLKKVKNDAKSAFNAAVKEIDDKNTIFAKKGITIIIHCMNDNSDVASYTFEK